MRGPQACGPVRGCGKALAAAATFALELAVEVRGRGPLTARITTAYRSPRHCRGDR